MPAVTTSSATGSRVLHKTMTPDASRTSQEHSTDPPAPHRASAAKGLPEISPGKRTSTSSTMSSKIKRFPTLLSRKESRSKGEITNGSGIPRSTANGDGRRKSTSGSAAVTVKPSTPTHGRSVSLASAAPSSLPRPVHSAGLPASATSPNLAGLADSGRQDHSSSPTSFGGSPRRVPPPGQESGIPRLITSPRSISGAPKQDSSDTQEIAHDASLNGHSPTHLGHHESESIIRSPSSTKSRAEGDDQPFQAATTDTATPAVSTPVTNVYAVQKEGSLSLESSDATAPSEHMSRTSSGSRMPIAMAKTASKNSIPQTGTSPDTTVPAMWRSNSYEGTAHAYITGSQSSQDTTLNSRPLQNDNMAPPNVNASQSNGEASIRQPAIGIEGLRQLESQPSLASNPSISYRIQLLRQLVHLRGEPVLSGVDVSQIVWAEGTDAHISAEEEFSRARNGKALSQAGSPVSKPPQLDQTVSTPSSNKKHGIFDRVTARFGGSNKPNQADTNASVSHSETSDVGSPRPSTQAQPISGDTEGPADKRGPVFGTPLQDIPPLAMAISIIGGQRHQLPILVFSLVEAIFKRGLDTSGIFRMNGNAASVQRLVEVYNTWPAYGDDHSTDDETIFTLCEVLKKYLKDLPEPLLGGHLWAVFVYGCLADRGRSDESEHYLRMAAVQVIFRLLPRKNMSLLIYLIAFLYQVSLRPANRLTTESISVIFGSSLLGLSRTATGAGTGINSSKASSEGLRWLLENWEDSLSQDLLDEDYDCFASPFVGQAAWSTPNLLGEMQSNPFNASNAAVAPVEHSRDGARPIDDHDSPVTAAAINTAQSPTTHTEMENVKSEPQTARDTGNQPALQTSNALQVSSSPSISSEDVAQGPPPSHKAGGRSVSGFAKGENFSEDNIASDPNAAQLFGSLSQLFNSERRKVKEYQQQVQELHARATQYEVVVKNLQASLAQSNNHIGTMQNQITAIQAKNDALEAEARRSSDTLQNHQDKLSNVMRTMEENNLAHASHLQELEEERQVLLREHASNIESQRTAHDRILEEERQALQQQHSVKEQEFQQLQKTREGEFESLQAALVSERTRLTEEIQQLREAVQVSDRERDGARAHLQRIRMLLDSA